MNEINFNTAIINTIMHGASAFAVGESFGKKYLSYANNMPKHLYGDKDLPDEVVRYYHRQMVKKCYKFRDSGKRLYDLSVSNLPSNQDESAELYDGDEGIYIFGKDPFFIENAILKTMIKDEVNCMKELAEVYYYQSVELLTKQIAEDSIDIIMDELKRRKQK